MTYITNEVDQAELEILNFEISDDALEAMAETGNAVAAIPTAPGAIICIPFEAQSRISQK